MSVVAQPRVVVPERGTTLRRHAVLTADDGRFRWVRWAGPQAPARLTELPAAVTAELSDTVTVAGSRIVPGEPWHGAHGYVVGSARSIAEEIVTSGGRFAAELATPVRELGRLLRQVHELRTDAIEPARPQALNRLAAWFRGEPGGRRRQAFFDRIGARRTELAGWLDELRGAGDPVLSHGWLGLGQVVRAPGANTVELMIGEDVGFAPWWYDVGWLAGHLLELRHFVGASQPASVWQALLDALWEGYGRRPDTRVHRAAVLDIVLHVHDFSAYFEVSDDEPAVWADLVLELMDRPAW